MSLFGHHHNHHEGLGNNTSTDGLSFLTDSEHENRTFLWLHVACMSIAFFMFPFGIALAARRSRLHIPVQILGTAVAVVGYTFGAGFSSSAPDLYPDNAHSSFGWWLGLLFIAQIGVGAAKRVIYFKWITTKESGSYMIMRNREGDTERFMHNDEKDAYRPDTHVTLLPSPSFRERPGSTLVSEGEGLQKKCSLDIESVVAQHHYIEDGERDEGQSIPFLRSAEPVQPNPILRIFRILRATHKIFGYLLLLFAYVQILLGLVTVSGTCTGEGLGNCLAHYIKGSLFVAFGLLTFARYLGCWAQYGWAWNTPQARSSRSSHRKDERHGFMPRLRIPSFSMLECGTVLAYGMTNTFLEHTGKDPNWNARDLQHASLAFMWWWAGALGVALESKWVQRRVLGMSSPLTNPILPLVFIATAYSMGGHHQNTIMSLTVHRQFAGFLMVAAVCRLISIVQTHRADAKSRTAMRGAPPTELIGAFCISAAGLTLAIANKSLLNLLDNGFHFDPNFVFNVVIAITSFSFLYFVALLGVVRYG